MEQSGTGEPRRVRKSMLPPQATPEEMEEYITPLPESGKKNGGGLGGGGFKQSLLAAVAVFVAGILILSMMGDSGLFVTRGAFSKFKDDMAIDISNVRSEQSILALKTDLTTYATVQSLADYAKKSELGNYATKSELGGYATAQALSDVAEDLEENYVTRSELDAALTRIKALEEKIVPSTSPTTGSGQVAASITGWSPPNLYSLTTPTAQPFTVSIVNNSGVYQWVNFSFSLTCISPSPTDTLVASGTKLTVIGGMTGLTFLTNLVPVAPGITQQVLFTPASPKFAVATGTTNLLCLVQAQAGVTPGLWQGAITGFIATTAP